ncbi:MAG: chorismate mutase [Alphaproteobacteria bacterium]|nr:chorismate mutase [Alphaproteobacteria bacterium]MBV9370485.1 chorismate mutase [Alphaproteobacteria bacterium]MBV9901118.1 chorismate mutase [Alphaproteobacteria bacterium]
MTNERVKPADCRTMAEVRFGVDRLDEAIVALMAERFGYMDAAARIKPVREAVRDEARKAQVLSNVVRRAERAGAPPAAVAEVYETLIEASIAYELERFDEARR